MSVGLLMLMTLGFADVPSDAEAWRALPPAVMGQSHPLPTWSRMLAAKAPKSTAALIQLDDAQRERSPIPPKLRAAMRWTAANANRCLYSETTALADLIRVGGTEEQVAGLQKKPGAGWTDSEQAAISFARAMTVDSDSVTDAEFSALVSSFGADTAASMVLLLAYSNSIFSISDGGKFRPGADAVVGWWNICRGIEFGYLQSFFSRTRRRKLLWPENTSKNPGIFNQL